ncbi:hypothetical protein Tco_0110796 [Tanacetum coccineum]
MDSIISLRQKNTLAEHMILSGADNRPPMLDKDLVIRTKKYAELSAAEKIQADCEMKATNIILQGLPADIYSFERECKLYDAFDKFTHIKGESLHMYYLRFTQLITDMNIYKMKMEQFQVNTKFLNSLPYEWSKFMTDVKLVKDLNTSNFDQLHAYLKQHELHANEYSYNNPQLQQQFSPSQYGSIQPNQQYSSHYPSQNQFNHSSIPPSHAFQSQMNHQTSIVPQVILPQSPIELMTKSPFVDLGFVVLVFSPGDDPIACLNKAMAFLTIVASSRHMARQCTQPKRPRNASWYKEKAMLAEAQEAGQLLDEDNSITAVGFVIGEVWIPVGYGDVVRRGRSYPWGGLDPGIPASQAQTVIPHNAAFQTDDLDTYDSDCDDLSTVQAVLIANISHYGFDVISEVPNSETYLNDMDNQSMHALQDFKQSPVMDFTDNKISSDSNIIPYSQYLQETQHATVQDTNLQAQQDLMILSVIEQMSEQMINHVNNREKDNKEQNNESIIAELERYKEWVKNFEQRLNIDLSSREKMIDSQMDDIIRDKLALKEQINSLEQNLSKQIKEKESLFKTFTVFKNESKEKENKYLENEIDLEKKIKELNNIVYKVGQSAQTVHMLTKPQAFYDNTHKQALGYQNPFYLKKVQRIKPTLYDDVVMSKTHVAMLVIDDEETLILEEESRSKMFEKAKDPEVIAKKNLSTMKN